MKVWTSSKTVNARLHKPMSMAVLTQAKRRARTCRPEVVDRAGRPFTYPRDNTRVVGVDVLAGSDTRHGLLSARPVRTEEVTKTFSLLKTTNNKRTHDLPHESPIYIPLAYSAS